MENSGSTKPTRFNTPPKILSALRLPLQVSRSSSVNISNNLSRLNRLSPFPMPKLLASWIILTPSLRQLRASEKLLLPSFSPRSAAILKIFPPCPNLSRIREFIPRRDSRANPKPTGNVQARFPLSASCHLARLHLRRFQSPCLNSFLHEEPRRREQSSHCHWACLPQDACHCFRRTS